MVPPVMTYVLPEPTVTEVLGETVPPLWVKVPLPLIEMVVPLIVPEEKLGAVAYAVADVGYVSSSMTWMVMPLAVAVAVAMPVPTAPFDKEPLPPFPPVAW